MKYIPESRFYWYELPEDNNGLLLDPNEDEFGYDRYSLNPFDGHPTREDAIESFIEHKNSYGYSVPSKLALLEVIKLVKETEHD